ncbi:hypothetical protein [Nonomuraea sp. bgisy101]|uniref:hypothetical protein n=1 Tax=Nonomuraea sp. bgisy101 TaxID=3413784 RepID=UPI003D72E0B9
MTAITATDPATAYPLLTTIAHGRALHEISLDVTLATPTYHGQTTLTIHPGVIDAEAIELYGHSQCAVLAGAIAERTGWPLLLIERYHDSDGWQPTHAAALTDDGLALDIYGPRAIADVLLHISGYGSWPLRHRFLNTWQELSGGYTAAWTEATDALGIEIGRVFASVLVEAVS